MQRYRKYISKSNTFFYEQMGKYGIIINKDIEVVPVGKPSYLKLSFIVIPAKIVDLITPFFRFLFIPRLMYVLSLILLVFFGVVIFNYFGYLMLFDLNNINWLYFGLLGFISVTFHEFGHASSAKYFGAKHGGIGGGFYLLMPVYFADVSDIWKLSRMKRIIVNLAGIYFEAIISSLYVMIGFLFESNTLIIVGVFVFIHSLWNLNPFLRNDGYWVLSDILNYPNLSRNSFILLQDFVKYLFDKEDFVYTPKNIFLIVYAFINRIFVFIFLYFSIKHYGATLITFPYDFVMCINKILYHQAPINFKVILNFLIPLMFYYIFFNFVKQFILQRKYMNFYRVKKRR